MKALFTSLRVTITTLVVCSGAYSLIVLGFAQLTPTTAQGSLITRPDGSVVGSHLLAQAFTQPQFFWPRPSAVDYNASAAGGSNKSPTNPVLTERAQGLIEKYGADAANPIPADLVAASGAGLDPHITEAAALYQAARVAKARNVNVAEIESLIRAQSFTPGGLSTDSKDRLINVLELNLALK